MTSPIFQTQQAIYRTLSDKLSTPLFTSVPQDQAFPYITFGNMQYHHLTNNLIQANIIIQAFSQQNNTHEITQISRVIISQLHQVNLTTQPSCHIINLLNTSTLQKLTDGKTWQITLTFNTYIYSNT